jgi:ABC-type multidrug transport system permease subunit
VDPFSYTVHALKNLLLKNTGFAGIYTDVAILLGFAALMTTASIALFRRQI